MKFSLDQKADVYTVTAYGRGYVELSTPHYSDRGSGDPSLLQEGLKHGEGLQTIRRSVVLLASQIWEWAPHSFFELEERHFLHLLEWEPEVVIVGTGKYLRFPPPRLTESLLARQVGVEFMDTPAACRTYNILVGEGRRVIAALLMI